jgi:Integrase core domain
MEWRRRDRSPRLLGEVDRALDRTNPSRVERLDFWLLTSQVLVRAAIRAPTTFVWQCLQKHLAIAVAKLTGPPRKPTYIAPGSPWENGFIELFNARLHDELLDGEIFYPLNEARMKGA